MKPGRMLLGILVGAGAVASALLATAGWRAGVQSRSSYTDGDRIRVPASGAPLRDVLWQPAEPVPGGADADRYEPRISADGSAMLFVRGRAGTNADLYTCRRTPTGWSDPEPIASINTGHDELGPELSRDGGSLYFYSDRPGGQGGYDIWVSNLASPAGGEPGWGEPVNLGPAVNTAYNEYGPALTPDGARLYFSSNRPRPGEPRAQRDAWPATVREEHSRHDYDLYVCDRESSGLTPAVAIAALNTASDEGAPGVSPAGDFLYFASDRAGGLGGFDVYRSRLLRGRPLAPENLGAAVNSPGNDLDPAPSTDGFRLYFSSDRPAVGAQAGPPAPEPPGPSTAPAEPARYALWVSGSREVFLETEPARAGELLARMWNAAWPWLLLLLLIMALALLFFVLLRDATFRRRLGQLSLMAKCLLISLLIHSILLSLLAVWRVGSAVGDLLSKPGGTRVSIASLGSGGLTAQVRGPAASVPVDSPVVASTRPNAPASEIVAPRITLAAAPAPLPTTVPAPAMSMEDSQPREVKSPATATPPSLSIIAPPRTPELAAPAAPITEPRPDVLAAAPVPASVRASVPPAPASSTAVSLLPDPSTVPDVRTPAPEFSELDAAPRAASRDVPSPDAAAAVPATPVKALSAARVPEAAPRESAATEPASSSNTTSAFVPAPVHAADAPHVSIGAATVSLVPEASTVPVIRSSSREASIADAPAPAAQASAAGPLTARWGTPEPAASRAADARIPSEATPNPPDPRGNTEATARNALDRAVSANMSPSPRPATPALIPGAAPTVRLDPLSGPDTGTPAMGASAIPIDATGSTPSAVGPAGPSPGSRADVPRGAAAGLSVRLPEAGEEPAAPAEVFAQRDPEVRAEVLQRTGGSAETERAVGLALEWFRAHQGRDGRWSGRHFDDVCGRCDGAAEIESDAAMTGLAVLCFLSAGHTHIAEGPHREAVRSALTWLVEREDSAGDLRRGETMYSQTIGAVALCEAYGMTRDPWLEAPARNAVMFVARGPARRQGSDTSASDTSVLGWQIMAIKSAERCGFTVPGGAMDDAARWLDRVSSRPAPGRFGYRPGETPSAAATAEAMFVRQLTGHGRDEAPMSESARFILATPPVWRRAAPTHYWYYATLALFQQQGEPWREWNAAVSKELLANQRHDGPAAGSWDPQDEWSQLGGRVYQTAVCTLSLEVYYRYRLAEPTP